ncbi:protein RST1-like isoform X2 [Rosa rugosa]|uniref:protein RST1-like isoform X2 n=1 Tax=Rosa rugosa TaxID=74645 RepID=UPI002B417373|nr:protein RST1-like isoform X2 [Rosa rugosa]
MQKSDDHQLQQYAAWAASFLRNHLWSKDAVNVDNSLNTDSGGSKSVSQSFADDSLVMKLSSWLMHLNFTRVPRLPTLDWGSIIRRGMRYEAQVAEMLPTESSFRKGILREECLKFSLAHANKFDQLLSFLDELSDLSRFSTLEWNLQSCVLNHLADLIKVFSGSRLEKLFDVLCNYFTSRQSYDTDETSLLRISCWKGLYKCLDEASLDSLEYISDIEKCMEVLFSLLPARQLAAVVGVGRSNSLKEWSEAVKCLGKARKSWLADFLQVSQEGLQQRDGQRLDVLKKCKPNLS